MVFCGQDDLSWRQQLSGAADAVRALLLEGSREVVGAGGLAATLLAQHVVVKWLISASGTVRRALTPLPSVTVISYPAELIGAGLVQAREAVAGAGAGERPTLGPHQRRVEPGWRRAAADLHADGPDSSRTERCYE